MKICRYKKKPCLQNLIRLEEMKMPLITSRLFSLQKLIKIDIIKNIINCFYELNRNTCLTNSSYKSR